METYYFTPGTPDDLQAVRDLINSRISWLEEKGIDQWPREAYWECYSESYFLNMAQTGRLHLLRRADTHTPVGVVVLRQEDPFWEDDGLACYIHNLATDPEERGAGSVMIHACEKLARSMGKRYLRLDCVHTNQKLNDYYRGLGYAYVGQLFEEDYTGNKYQKEVGGSSL